MRRAVRERVKKSGERNANVENRRRRGRENTTQEEQEKKGERGREGKIER